MEREDLVVSGIRVFSVNTRARLPAGLAEGLERQTKRREGELERVGGGCAVRRPI